MNQPVISTASRKDVAPLAVEDTLEEDAASVELVMQAAQWVDVDLAFDSKALQVGHENVETGEYGRDSLSEFSAFHDGL